MSWIGANWRNTLYKRKTAGGDYTSTHCAREFEVAQDTEQELQQGADIIRTYRYYTKRPDGPSIGLMTEVKTRNVGRMYNLISSLTTQPYEFPEASAATSVIPQGGRSHVEVADPRLFDRWMEELNSNEPPQSVFSAKNSSKRKQSANDPEPLVFAGTSAWDLSTRTQQFYGQQSVQSKRPALSYNEQPYGMLPPQSPQHPGQGWQAQLSHGGGWIQHQPSYGGAPFQGHLGYEQRPPSIVPTAFMYPTGPTNMAQSVIVSHFDQLVIDHQPAMSRPKSPDDTSRSLRIQVGLVKVRSSGSLM